MTGPAPIPTEPNASGRAPFGLEAVIRSEAMHPGDRVPDWLLRTQVSIVGRVSPKMRTGTGIIVAVFAVILAMVIAAADVLGVVVDDLDLIAYLGLFLANWLGNGGALVPIPGLRLFALLMLFQQAVVLDPVEAMLIAVAAMSLGLLSYYLAGAASAREHHMEGSPAADGAVGGRTVLESADDASAGRVRIPETSAPGAIPQSLSGHRLKRCFLASLQKGQAKAQPIIEGRGTSGVFWLCFAPSPLATAGAFASGTVGLGFVRFMLAAFSSKLLLAALVTLMALLFAS